MGRLGRNQPRNHSYLRGPVLPYNDAPMSPTSDVSVGAGWTTNAGSSSNLYATLDEHPRDSSDYVKFVL